MLKNWTWYYILFMVVICVGCYNFKKVEIGKISGIKVNDISLKSADIAILIPIRNPNNFSFKVSKLDAEVFFNEMRIGIIENTKKVKVHANSEEVYEFPLQVEYSNPLSGLLVLIKMLGKDEADIRVKGYLKASSGIFSRKVPIDEQSAVKIFKDE